MFELFSLLFSLLLSAPLLELSSLDSLTTKETDIITVVSVPEIAPPSVEENSFSNSIEPISTILIKNAIEPKMLEYKHWTGIYSPELFTVTINNIPFENGSSYVAASTQEPLVIEFHYSFMNGIRKGSKKVYYELDEECQEATLTFSWLDEWKLLLDNATPIKEETI